MAGIVLLLVLSLFAASNSCHAGDYRIGAGDVLRIKVYDNPDLDTVTRVSGDGNIHLPLLGNVKLLDLTVLAATRKLEKLLADGYLVNPQVSIYVEEFKSKKAMVLGMVNHPGLYELSGPITLLELISKAGGLSRDAGKIATVKRSGTGDKGQDVVVIDLSSLLEKGDLSRNIQIRDNDTVIIAKAGMCYVTGEVKRPDAYKVENGATVLKMITMAGGFTGKAAENRVQLIRVIQGQKKEYNKVDLDTRVQADDVIVVPESFF